MKNIQTRIGTITHEYRYDNGRYWRRAVGSYPYTEMWNPTAQAWEDMPPVTMFVKYEKA